MHRGGAVGTGVIIVAVQRGNMMMMIIVRNAFYSFSLVPSAPDTEERLTLRLLLKLSLSKSGSRIDSNARTRSCGSRRPCGTAPAPALRGQPTASNGSAGHRVVPVVDGKLSRLHCVRPRGLDPDTATRSHISLFSPPPSRRVKIEKNTSHWTLPGRIPG